MNDFISVIDMRINTRNALIKWSGRNRKLERMKSVNKTVKVTIHCKKKIKTTKLVNMYAIFYLSSGDNRIVIYLPPFIYQRFTI